MHGFCHKENTNGFNDALLSIEGNGPTTYFLEKRVIAKIYSAYHHDYNSPNIQQPPSDIKLYSIETKTCGNTSTWLEAYSQSHRCNSAY